MLFFTACFFVLIDHSGFFPYSHSVTIRKEKEQHLLQFVLSLHPKSAVYRFRAGSMPYNYDLYANSRSALLCIYYVKKKFTVLQAISFKNFIKIYF